MRPIVGASVIVASILLIIASDCEGSTDEKHLTDLGSLVTDTFPPRVIELRPTEKQQIIADLKAEQRNAKGHRRQEVAFILAAFGIEYTRNRDFLVLKLAACSVQGEARECDENTVGYLMSLYQAGHHEVLAPLVAAGPRSDGAVSEALAQFFTEALKADPRAFFRAVTKLPTKDRDTTCEMTGGPEGGVLSSEDLTRIHGAVGSADNPLLNRCLNEIEAANNRTAN